MTQNISISETAHSASLEKGTLDLNSPQSLEWLADAGFGLFIHWSVDVQLGCVISHSLVGASEDYCDRYFKQLPKTFNPYLFNADSLADLAVIMGVKYVVFTTKHHNGFCMWNTSTTDFNIMNTPFGRDILTEYTAALRARGLKIGFYFSPEDFRFLYENDQPIARGDRPPYNQVILKKYMDMLEAQLTELTTRYGRVDMFFFDGDFAEHCKAVVWKHQPNILVTRGAIATPEQSLGNEPSHRVWEACITMGSAWQYQPTNEEYKSGRRCIELLIEARARGGSLLLNAGLDSYGRFPEVQDGLMREIGLWYFINHEALESTRPAPVSREGDTWFTCSKDGRAVYAFLCGEKDWKRAERRTVHISCLECGESPHAVVLGTSGERTEYHREGIDAATHITPCEDGILLDICNAQRIYCAGSKCWPNPLVIKLTGVSFRQ